MWLKTEPRSPLIGKDYDLYVGEHNRRCEPGDRIISRDGIRAALNCSWTEALAVAQGEKSLGDLNSRTLDDFVDDTSNPLHLITANEIAAVLGMHRHMLREEVCRGRMPAAVYDLDGQACWLKEDIEDRMNHGVINEGRPG
jgi:hypothetical protein